LPHLNRIRCVVTINIKHIFIAFVLLAFVGQSFAAVYVHCSEMSTSVDMADTGGHAGVDHSVHDGHAGHSSPTASVDTVLDNTSSKDCCDPSSDCAMASCTSALVSDISVSASVIATEALSAYFYVGLVKNAYQSALFRPPIYS